MAKEMVSKKPSDKLHVFDVVNYIVFILIGLVIIVPIWKVVVDSFNKVGVYQFMLWPNSFTLDGYKTIIGTQQLYMPFIISVVTTLLGTLLGLVLSTLGGYVLVQFEMPGRNIFRIHPAFHHDFLWWYDSGVFGNEKTGTGKQLVDSRCEAWYERVQLGSDAKLLRGHPRFAVRGGKD